MCVCVLYIIQSTKKEFAKQEKKPDTLTENETSVDDKQATNQKPLDDEQTTNQKPMDDEKTTNNNGASAPDENIVKNTLHDFIQLLDKSQERLQQMESLGSWQKVLFGIYDWRIICLTYFWIGCILVAWFCFHGFDDKDSLNYGLRIFFVLLVLVVNHHLALLAFCVIFAIPFIIFTMLFFPCCFPLLFYKKQKPDEKEKA